MARTSTLSLFALVLFASPALADICQNGATLQSLINLGSSGCSSGQGLVLHDFSYTETGTTPASGVTVDFLSEVVVVILFDGKWAVSGGASAAVDIRFFVDNIQPAAHFSSLTLVNTTGDGIASVPTAGGALVSPIDLQLGLSSGPGGSASVRQIYLSISNVPEPSSIFLLGSSMLGLVRLIARRRSA